MEIQNNTNISVNNTENNNPNFKAGVFNGALAASGGMMQSIENGGFLASFIIQDFVGMTVPRSAAGFLRDKEETGEYNFQEGFEVLGREGLTGPCMMAVAPVGLMVAAKFGRSTGVNTKLIKNFGESLKKFVSNPNFDKKLLNNSDKFKEQFYKTNVEKLLIDTLGKENVKDETIEYICKQLKNYDKIPANAKLDKFRGKAKYRSKCLNNITNCINEIKYSTGSDLEMLQRVKLSDGKTVKTKEAFEALIKYSDDAISANKQLEKLDELQAEKIKNISLGKRLITNIALLGTTLSVLFTLPKIYARSNTAPGARKKTKENKNNNQEKQVTFQAKKPKAGLLERLGKLLSKIKSDFVSNELEYNGHNFTNTLMAGLSLFGLLTPRGLRAYNRAEKDENGKKDLTELWEILIRDVTSSLAVVFLVPMGTRACVSSYENQSGFVLVEKDRTPKSKFKNFLDKINPYSKTHVLTNSEIIDLYNGVDSKDKMVNFCKYIDRNGGDLEKILSKSDYHDAVFNSSTIELSSLKGKAKAEKNKEILKVIEKINNSDGIKKMMQGVKAGKYGNITTVARGLNSIPTALFTVAISPYILGWFIPRLTYANTRRIHEKQDKEKEQHKLNSNI